MEIFLPFLILLVAIATVVDCTRSRLIRFRRLDRKRWEIAFNQHDLELKLNGDMAEILMPARPLVVRLWRRFFPLHRSA